MLSACRLACLSARLGNMRVWTVGSNSPMQIVQARANELSASGDPADVADASAIVTVVEHVTAKITKAA